MRATLFHMQRENTLFPDLGSSKSNGESESYRKERNPSVSFDHRVYPLLSFVKRSLSNTNSGSEAKLESDEAKAVS